MKKFRLLCVLVVLVLVSYFMTRILVSYRLQNTENIPIRTTPSSQMISRMKRKEISYPLIAYDRERGSNFYPQLVVDMNKNGNRSIPKELNRHHAWKQLYNKELEPKLTATKVNYMFNASNIRDITIIRYLNKGLHKKAFLGLYRGMQVVVRTTRKRAEGTECIGEQDVEKTGFLQNTCFRTRPFRDFLREICLLHLLQHPNIAKLLGYCLNCEVNEGNQLQQTSIVIVTEYCEQIKNQTFLQYLYLSKQIAELFHFLEHFPLGSLLFEDMKTIHFLLLNSEVKMIDIESLTETKQKCDENWHCHYNISCDKDIRLCPGYNAKWNMVSLYQMIFRKWLEPSTFPESIRDSIVSLRDDLEMLKLDASQLGSRVQAIIDFWRECCAGDNPIVSEHGENSEHD